MKVSPFYNIMNLITRHFKETPIVFNHDGWINATQTAKAFNKDIRVFMRSKNYKDYSNALKNYKNSDALKLHITFKGNTKKQQGTFLHPDLLIVFARWLSPEFAVWCDMEIVKNYFESLISKQQIVIDELVEERDKNKWWMND